MALKKAIGQRGSWFASVDGEQLPCVHKYWLTGLLYHDPYLLTGPTMTAAKIDEYIQAISQVRRVILTDDTPQLDGYGKAVGFKRNAYIAVFEVEDVVHDEVDGLRFGLSKRLADLK